MKDLTSKQQAIFDYIVQRVENPGRFPSYREIGRKFHLRSVATVAQHLKALEEKGFLMREGRQLNVPDGLRSRRGVSVLGLVQAGEPLAAEENFDGELRLEDLGTDTFAVRVKGDSMIEAGIFEGDYVIVEPRETVHDGEMVVAVVGDDQSITVKYFHRTSDGVELRPANESYEPIRVADDPSFRLAGRVVGVLRKL